MAYLTFVSIDCLIMTAYYVFVILQIADFKRSPKLGSAVITAYFLLYNCFDWLTTFPDETGTAPELNLDLSMISSLIYLIFVLTIFALFMKGNPVVNYGLLLIVELFNTIMLFVAYGLRERLLPDCPPIGRADSWGDWPVLLFELLAYGGAALAAYLSMDKLKQLASWLPKRLVCGVVLATLLLNEIMFTVMLLHVEHISRTLIVMMTLTFLIMILLLLIFFSILRQYQQETLSQALLSLEMQLEYEYYAAVCRMGEQLRHLKHDMANHLAVMESLRQTDSEDWRRYRQQLLVCCGEIKAEAAAFLPPEQLQLPQFTKRENYALLCYLKTLLPGDTPELRSLTPNRAIHENGYCALDIRFPKNANHLKRRRNRETLYFKLIAMAAERCNGRAEWKKGDDRWTLSIHIS